MKIALGITSLILLVAVILLVIRKRKIKYDLIKVAHGYNYLNKGISIKISDNELKILSVDKQTDSLVDDNGNEI